jgi:hypothetical protein
MKKSSVICNCLICDTKFEVILSRADTAKYCSRQCYHNSTKGNLTWNAGKKYEELYGFDKADELKRNLRIKTSGINNPMYNKKHKDETKKLMSIAKENYTPANKGKKFPGIFSDVDRTGQNNAYVKHVMKTENISYDEYLKSYDEYDLYRKQVRNITNLQPIHLLENYEKRGNGYENEDAYHLDHIYPISKGFKNGIPPEVIGDISNLKFIHWLDNLKKSNKL